MTKSVRAEQVAKRNGLYPSPFRNPYPLPGEDPNTTNGGNGQLPLGLIQGKDDRGRWTGLIGASCSACHDSRLGTTSESSFAWGLPNSANDAGLLASDMFRTTPITTLGELLPHRLGHALARGQELLSIDDLHI